MQEPRGVRKVPENQLGYEVGLFCLAHTHREYTCTPRRLLGIGTCPFSRAHSLDHSLERNFFLAVHQAADSLSLCAILAGGQTGFPDRRQPAG